MAESFVQMTVCVSCERLKGPQLMNVDRMQGSASCTSELVGLILRSLDSDQVDYISILSHNSDDGFSTMSHHRLDDCVLTDFAAAVDPSFNLAHICIDSEDILAVVEDSELYESDAILPFDHTFVVVEVSCVCLHLSSNVCLCWAEGLHQSCNGSDEVH